MSEEIGGPSINFARSLILSIVLNGATSALTFGMLLAVLFCT